MLEYSVSMKKSERMNIFSKFLFLNLITEYHIFKCGIFL